MWRTIAFAAVNVAFVYSAAWLITGFVEWDLNPAHWDIAARLSSATIGTCFVPLAIATSAILGRTP
jgi:hypothetical protein